MLQLDGTGKARLSVGPNPELAVVYGPTESRALPVYVWCSLSSDTLLFLLPSKSISAIFSCVLGMILLTCCGTPGIPLPPSLELPKPVTDLHAVRKGNKVYLTWTAPTQTTDRQTIRHFGATRICRNVDSATTAEVIGKEACGNEVGSVPWPQRRSSPKPEATPVPKPVEKYTDELSAAGADVLGEFTYAIEVANGLGRSAGLSNKVQVPSAPTLPPPVNFAAQISAEGVSISWTPLPQQGATGLRYVYRIYRREENGKDNIAGELALDAPARFVDHNFEWEKRYSYRATVVTLIHREPGPEAQVEGDDTPEVSLFAHDIFPPAAPSGLQAVYSGENQQVFVDLIWNPNPENDLAGYNVFRHENGATAAKINSDLVKLPAFRDLNVSAGKKYYYSVSAVDTRGNESAPSEEANETVP
jgi:hypothetical protein